MTDKRIERLEQRVEALDERLRELEIAVARLAGKLHIIEYIVVPPSGPPSAPSQSASE